MTIERALRALAGFFVMLSVALGYCVHPGLVPVHRVRGAEPVPVGVHEHLPGDADLPQDGPSGLRPRRDAGRATLRLEPIDVAEVA